MPKYLITASYSAEGLQKDKASGRIRAATAAIEGLGGPALLTVEEVDRALAKRVNYRTPGR